MMTNAEVNVASIQQALWAGEWRAGDRCDEWRKAFMTDEVERPAVRGEDDPLDELHPVTRHGTATNPKAIALRDVRTIIGLGQPTAFEVRSSRANANVTNSIPSTKTMIPAHK